MKPTDVITTKSGLTATLYLADCLTVLPTLGKVDAVITDPPYGISVAGAANESPKGRRNFDFFEGDADCRAMRETVNQRLAAARMMAEPTTAVVWCGHRQISNIADGFEDAGFSTRLLLWRKKCPAPTAPGAGFQSAFETAVYAYKPGRTWNGTQNESNIFECDSYRYGQPGKVDHPTQKPERLMDWLLRLLCAPGQTILDPFMGSGTTGVAALRMGCNFIGIEISDKYYAIAKRRIMMEAAQGSLFQCEKHQPTPARTAEIPFGDD